MSVEEIVKDLRNEMESIYSRKECLSEKLFVLCSHCKKRIIDSIVEDEYLAIKNDCRECQPSRQELTDQVTKLFEELQFGREELQRDLQNRANRKSLIAILYGVFSNGPNVPLSFPQVCSFELTYRCNLKCKHCYIGTPPTTQEMDTKSALQAIEKIAETGFVGIPLSGGEPLLRNDLLSLAKETKSYDMDVILSTNGTLLSQDRAKELRPYVDVACISLDSHVESIHDNFRGLEGAQKMTLKGIKNCLDNDIPVRIFTTLTKFNHEKLPELINFIVELGVKEIALFDLNLVGRGCNIGQEFQLTLEEFKKSATALLGLKNQSAARVDVLAPFNFIKDDQYVNKLTLLSGGFCNAGISTLNISPDGEIQPCSRVRINLGNVLTDNLKEIWKDSPALKALRDRERLKGTCGKCEYKYVCGGCRANAYAEHSDYLMEDPRCM